MTSTAVATTSARGATGVYYRHEDYAGVFRRLLIDAVDVVVATVISVAVTRACWSTFAESSAAQAYSLIASWTAVWFVYFTLLKRSKIRTAGYWIGGVRIVNLQGVRPGIIWLTMRLLFALLGPFNVVIDLFWIGNDDRRQALRDKFARTYVIRRRALPAGSGPIRYEYYTLMGTSFIFPEVVSSDGGKRRGSNRS